jgi:hypothetical protein
VLNNTSMERFATPDRYKILMYLASYPLRIKQESQSQS